MDNYGQMVVQIIQAQEVVIGPVAVMQAQSVSGLQLDWEHKSVSIKGDGRTVLDDLVQAYKQLFGQISVDVCKEAVGRIIGHMSADELPASLR